MSDEKRRLTVGILAHVDAGKTTLSESLLFTAGSLRRMGRVDHGDCFLDSDPMERERGITIFSKIARLSRGNTEIILLDTPGHVDFSAETERTLSVLDYAILVISATDGVQNHTLTLWQLLARYRVPTFIFINKTDLASPGAKGIEESLRSRLSPAVTGFFPDEDRAVRDERLAMTAESLLEPFLCAGLLSDAEIARAIAERQLFPCFFGSALRREGVEEFLDGICRFTLTPPRKADFAAKVYKIARCDGQRFTWMKITGGSLSVRDEICYTDAEGHQFREKAAQIRLYSGEKFTPADTVLSGDVCAVLGLSSTFAGQGLGQEPDSDRPVLEPVLTYRVTPPPECDVNQFFRKIKVLEEEDPALHIEWNEGSREIRVGLMGDVQTDVLRRTVRDRFGVDVDIDEGSILYKETLSHAAEGVGHFEPLRHYAEVHLLIEPQPEGTGLIFGTNCPEDQLDRNWQRLILTHLGEKNHVGVLTGSPVTDLKITILTGRAHPKHTEGGDFREATYRAVRQGLMQVPSILLEPYYRYTLTVPAECTGRAMNDLQSRVSSFDLENSDGEYATITGRGPVSELRDYARQVTAYTHGAGRFFCTFDGYSPCHNSEEVIAAIGYDPTSDLANTPDSVFCYHGAGTVIPWDQVRAHMHLFSGYNARGERNSRRPSSASILPILPSSREIARKLKVDDRELDAIMEREFGPIRRRQYSEKHTSEAEKVRRSPAERKELLIIDGYNLIWGWDRLASLAEDDLEAARNALMDVLSGYAAFTGNDIILVFDAYNVKEGGGEREFIRDGYKVVYTAANETGDAYIEKLIHSVGASFRVRVVTSDRLIQFSAVSVGVLRMSAREFAGELEKAGNEITEFIEKLAKEQE